MEPELEDGNIEYKLKLLDISTKRIERLTTQMRYRCDEGGGECIYNLGVEDDGTMTGLTQKEYDITIQCILGAAHKNNYKVCKLTKSPVDEGRNIYEVLLRENNDNSYIDIKVAIAGNVDAGKSTLLSVLTQGKNDNGRGSARLAVFNFPHEIISGRTSSIGHQILGYNTVGEVMNYQGNRGLSWPDIVKRSSKVVSFYDLAGHEKYLKTTIFGLSSSMPDICIILVGANKGIMKMTREHIFLCKTLDIPFCIVVTKIDMTKECSNVMEDTMHSINTILKRPGIRRMPLKIKNDDDIVRCAMNIHSKIIVPIFTVSNVTLEGIPLLHKFLNLTPKRLQPIIDSDVECQLDTSWTVPGVGTVIGGHLIQGVVKVGDKLWFGPNQNSYTQVIVKSIHCKKVPLQKVEKSCYICIGVRGITKFDFNKGNVLVSKKKQQILCENVIAEVEVLLSHSTTIRVGYQPMLHTLNLRTSVVITDITNKISSRDSLTDNDMVLRTGDTAKVSLKLNFGKKFIKNGSSILLCEGMTKVVGKIISIDCLPV
jgi:small GTP-binding protein